MSSVGFTLVGRLSDIFGRRYFFAGCSAFGTIGCIIGCTANSINQLIAASVFLGLAAAGQISFNYVLGELVPVRHRFPANGIIFFVGFPFSGMGPYIARLFIVRSAVGWRGIYYSSLALRTSSYCCPKTSYIADDTQMLLQQSFGYSATTLQNLKSYIVIARGCKKCGRWISEGSFCLLEGSSCSSSAFLGM